MLSAVLGATVIAVPPVRVGAAEGELQLVAQSFNVAPDGQLTATVALPTNLVDTDLSTMKSGQSSDVVVAGRITQIVDIKAVLEQRASWLTPGPEAVTA